MSDDTGEIDREGVGMLYAGAAGIMVGSSVVQAAGYAAATGLGAIVMFCALAYGLHQKSLAEATTEADQ